MEDTALILKEMNVKEEDNITMCELFDQYTRRGRQEGIKEGLQEGVCKTIIKNVEALMKNFHLDLQKACTGLGISVEEYTRAKEQAILQYQEITED